MPIHSLLLLQDGHMLFDQAATLGTKCECVWAHDCCFFFSSCEWYSLTVSIRMLTHCKGQRWHLGRLPVRSQRRQMSSGLCELSLKYYTLNTCHHRRKKNKTQQTKKNMYYASAQLIKCIFNETEAICVLQAGQIDWSRKLAAFILGRINVLNYNAYAIRYVCTICKRANTDRQRLGCERREWTNKQTIQIKYAYIPTTWIDIVYTTKTYICIYILFNLHIVSVNLETRK